MKNKYLELYRKINSNSNFKALVSVLLLFIIYPPLVTAFLNINIPWSLQSILIDMLFFVFPIFIPLSILFIILFFYKYYLLKILLCLSLGVAFPFHIVAGMTVHTTQEAIAYFSMFILPYILFIIILFIKKKKKSKLEDELNIVKVTLEPLEYEEIKEILTTKASMYDVIRAVSYYRLLRTSYGAGGTSFGARPVEIYTHKVQRDISKAHQRLKRVVIENKDFEDLIKQYDAEDSFFYCDPPYFGTEQTYDAPFYSNDHERLYHVLSNIKGKFLLSYDDSHYIRNLYKDFYIISVKRLNNLKQRYDPGSEFKEILISNYDILKIKKEKTIQLELWSEEHGI